MSSGLVVRPSIDHLPSGASPKPVWLWSSRLVATAVDVGRCWMSLLRREQVVEVSAETVRGGGVLVGGSLQARHVGQVSGQQGLLEGGQGFLQPFAVGLGLP